MFLLAAQETTKRLGIFLRNLDTINRHNAQPNPSFHMGVNQFSDLTFEEFSAQFLMQAPQAGCSATARALSESDMALDQEKKASLLASRPAAPPSRDWRDSDAVTPVKNQVKRRGRRSVGRSVGRSINRPWFMQWTFFF